MTHRKQHRSFYCENLAAYFSDKLFCTQARTAHFVAAFKYPHND